MSEMLFISLITNFVVFSGLGMLTWSAASWERVKTARYVKLALSLTCWALVLGATAELALVVVELGWPSGEVTGSVIGTWQLVESLAVTCLGAAAASIVRRVDMKAKAARRVL